MLVSRKMSKLDRGGGTLMDGMHDEHRCASRTCCRIEAGNYTRYGFTVAPGPSGGSKARGGAEMLATSGVLLCAAVVVCGRFAR